MTAGKKLALDTWTKEKVQHSEYAGISRDDLLEQLAAEALVDIHALFVEEAEILDIFDINPNDLITHMLRMNHA